MSNDNTFSRRQVLRAAVALSPAAALGGCATLSDSTDRDPLVRESDPVARAVAYYPDTRDVPADHPLATGHSPAQMCSNCVHVRGPAGPGARECPTFPGRRVSDGGWCSIWAPAASS